MSWTSSHHKTLLDPTLKRLGGTAAFRVMEIVFLASIFPSLADPRVTLRSSFPFFDLKRILLKTASGRFQLTSLREEARCLSQSPSTMKYTRHPSLVCLLFLLSVG